MLGLVLLYFIGKWFFTLAETHKRNKWLFAVLGVVMYYAGTFIAGIAIGLYTVSTGDESILEMNSIVLSLIAIPFGLLAAWGFREILKRSWEKNPLEDQMILDSDIADNSNELE